MSAPLLITFAGVPGSGKTPISYYLSWQLRLPILNNDAMRREAQEDTLKPDVESELYYQMRDERLTILTSRGKSFIYDASVDRIWKDKKEFFISKGFKPFVISLNVSPGLISKMAKAKGYVQDEFVAGWQKEHESFLERFQADVSLVITDENYNQRMAICLDAVKKALND